MRPSLLFLSPLLRTDDLMQAAKAVTNVTLSNHLVEVVFALFDENSEFVSLCFLVMFTKEKLPNDTHEGKASL